MIPLIMIALLLLVVAVLSVTRHRKLSSYKNTLKSPHRHQSRR